MHDDIPIRVGFASSVVNDSGVAREGWRFADDLQCGVMLMEAEGIPAAVITLDTVLMPDQGIAVIKSVLADTLGMDAERICLMCSHTHSSPEFDSGTLARAISRIAEQAAGRMEEARVAHVRVDAGGFSANRRVSVNETLGTYTIIFDRNTKMDPGSGKPEVHGQIRDFLRYGSNTYAPVYADAGHHAQPFPGKPSPAAERLLQNLSDTILLDGPVDPHLELVAFRHSDGRSLGTLVRFSCHPVLFQGRRTKEYSADYPGVLRSVIARATDAPVLFMLGPCGDVKPAVIGSGRQNTERFGTALAARATGALEKAVYEPLDRIFFSKHSALFEVASDMATQSEGAFSAAIDRYQRQAAGPFDPAALKLLQEEIIRRWAADLWQCDTRTYRLPAVLVGFNDIRIAAMPGEVFTETSLNLKRRFPKNHLVTVSQADVCDLGYLPPRGEYPRGGYEPSQSVLVPGAAERLEEMMADLIRAHEG